MRTDLPSGTVTLLFTDVEGSTRLLHSLGADDYADALAGHRRVIREACASQGGVEVDTQGDAFFFAFPSAAGAIAAASAFTEALVTGPISVRVGLHTGTPLLTDEGYVGDDVHFAARVAGSGHGGQVILSSATAGLVELSLTDLGEHRLKDIEGAVSIYQLGDGSFPPLKTISNTNLPRPASSFVGRDGELEDVLSRIEGGARLLTLTGPGGTGKTRLALEAAATLVPSYKAGVFWVGLASLRDPALVQETIALTLGAKDGLAAYVGERELLLLLDNLEQVIEAAPDLSSLLQSCPNLTMLVTSRELLRVDGEVEYPVPPLASPEAVSLFCERAQTEPSDEITELCVRLDSLPLAVELAAARTKALTPVQVLERLSGRLDLLRGGRDADPRQQTLRATIEWSYELLTPEEQALFARLSVFAGGCTLEAAVEVCDASLDTLQSLVEKSLLRFTNERYWMLGTIREYAGEGLERSGEGDELGRRHSELFLRLAERTRTMLRGPAQTAWLDRLDAEHDNLRSALVRLLRERPADGARLAASLTWFWQLRSHLAEGEAWVAAALDVDPDLDVRAALAQARSQLTYYRDEVEAAELLMQEAVALWREAGDELRESESLAYLGVVAVEVGHEARGIEAMDASVELARRLGDPWTLGFALWAVGASIVQGRSPRTETEAREALGESVTLLRSVGDPWALGASRVLPRRRRAAGRQPGSRDAALRGGCRAAATGGRQVAIGGRALEPRPPCGGGRRSRASRVHLDAEVEAFERDLGQLSTTNAQTQSLSRAARSAIAPSSPRLYGRRRSMTLPERCICQRPDTRLAA